MCVYITIVSAILVLPRSREAGHTSRVMDGMGREIYPACVSGVYICIYMYIHVYTYICVFMYIPSLKVGFRHVHIFICTHVCVYMEE